MGERESFVQEGFLVSSTCGGDGTSSGLWIDASFLSLPLSSFEKQGAGWSLRTGAKLRSFQSLSIGLSRFEGPMYNWVFFNKVPFCVFFFPWFKSSSSLLPCSSSSFFTFQSLSIPNDQREREVKKESVTVVVIFAELVDLLLESTPLPQELEEWS